ncbi:MAG TPA: DUF5565 family protein [Pseudonocardia sp.]
MRKIPTLFKRDPEDMSQVLSEVNPAAAWVFEDVEHVQPTRKYDGTCVKRDDGIGGWWARREVKPGKKPPENYWPEETDPNTGKTVGWEPIGQSPFFKAWQEAIGHEMSTEPGTYELCGPKINGNPEGFEHHVLIRHAEAEHYYGPMNGYDDLRGLLAESPYEGIVWHHDDGRMAKLKRRDFGFRS